MPKIWALFWARVLVPETGPPQVLAPGHTGREKTRGAFHHSALFCFSPRASEAQAVFLVHCVGSGSRSVCEVHYHTFVLVLATTCSVASHRAPCLLPSAVTFAGTDSPARRASSWKAWCFAGSSTDVSFVTGQAVQTQTTAVCFIVCLFAGLLFSFSQFPVSTSEVKALRLILNGCFVHDVI